MDIATDEQSLTCTRSNHIIFSKSNFFKSYFFGFFSAAELETTKENSSPMRLRSGAIKVHDSEVQELEKEGVLNPETGQFDRSTSCLEPEVSEKEQNLINEKYVYSSVHFYFWEVFLDMFSFLNCVFIFV